jgi:predicted transcriptional regulator
LKRHPIEVMVKLLQFAQEEKRKTKIMYNCNLSYNTITSTINLLLKAGLLQKKQKYYITTAKGLEFIKKFGEIENIFNTNRMQESCGHLTNERC